MENNKKKLYLIIIILVMLMIIGIGTYALSIWMSKENTELTFRIAQLEGCIVNKGIDINISNIGPVFDYEQDGEMTAFNVINLTEEVATVNVNFNISSITDNLKEESFKYVLLSSTDNINYTKVKEDNFVNVNNNSTVELIKDYELTSSIYFKLYIYIDGNMLNPSTMKGGSLIGSISLNACEVKLTPEQVLTKLGLTANTTTPNFSNIATTDEGIFSAEDDLGTSYYFRGAVTNNYVRFANFYWRIIRINGDGSIRMIYDGTSAHANGESSTDRRIGESAYNSSYDDNAYVGYMYGTTGSSTYEATHANTNNSTIKTYIDNWYKTNIVDAGYSGSVVDAIYCNDREVSTADTTNYPGNGSGTSKTAYKAYYERLINIANTTPTLKCNQATDRFTTGATIEVVTGNGKLTYPVGLITADEVSMAGGKFDVTNSSYYLYTNNSFLTISPFNFDGSVVGILFANSGGDLSATYVIAPNGVRPVLSLSSSAITGGTGSSTDPFVAS